MTRLDSEHAIIIPSPTTAPDTVLTTPLLPGLEFHLPANTVIVDHEGHPTRRLTITPIPLDKTPFPLPLGVAVPIYFTIQPGGSYIDVRSTTNATLKGGRLIYPNSFGNNPGTIFDFWNYDAESRGWYIYGQGKVTSDGKQIVPNPGVIVYQLTGAMVGSSGVAPGTFPTPGGNCCDGDPVDLSTGLFEYDKTDLFVSDVMPLQLERTYRTNDSQQRPFGIGTTHNYDFFMVGDVSPYTYQELIEPNGSRIRFNRISSGTQWWDAVYENTDAGTPYYGALLSWNTSGLPGAWLLTLRNGTRFSFPDSDGQSNQDCQAVLQITDRHNNAIKFQRATGTCQLLQLTTPSGRYISFQYDASQRVTSATDNIGRSVTYQYDPQGNLATVTNANGGTTSFTYDANHNMLTITDPRSIIYLTNEYDSYGRVTQQTHADGGVYQFSWTASNNSFQGWQIVCPECQQGGSFSRYSPNDSEGYLGLITSVSVTDPRGYIRQVQFSSYGYAMSDTLAVGQSQQETFSYAYYADDLLESVTDALNRTTSFNYDSLGNGTVITRLAGSSNPITTTFTYTPDFSQLATATDPLGHTTIVGHDQAGDATSITDPMGDQTTASYNSNGQIKSVADSLGNSVSFGYMGGDLATVTDPLGNRTTLFDDLVGRVISLVDAAGNATEYQYNNLDQVLTITDALGNNTNFVFDPDGDLHSVTDVNAHTNTYAYDSMDRVITRTDPLSRSESYSYDFGGNLVSLTDRKQQVSNYSYDPLNRLASAAFGVVNGVAQSGIVYSYDAGNRLYQAADSLSGTITRGYDLLDRLSSETTPQGSVSYTYDNSSRRSTMQVSGQTLINYSWDNANRLTGITQGSTDVGFTYDTDSRRATMTLPDGIVAGYSYDNDSHLSGISYSLGQSSIGTLSYGYDPVGRRTSISGSLAGQYSASAGAVFSASYDAANELTNWNGTQVTPDANGNTINDGVHVYSWDTRNHLVALDSGGTASFLYDAFGRRAVKTVFGTSPAFLYDLVNPVQELSGTTPTANLLTGGVDEYFARADSTGTVNYLNDALGSTLALAGPSGNLQTQYGYGSFGNTSVSGASSSSSFQYTGRENDGIGLYYNRTRYYDPQIGRFISEDPIGLAGGPNAYAYAANAPVVYRDPSGKIPIPLITGGIGALAGGLGDLAGQEIANFATGHPLTNIDWKEAGIATGTGFVAGAAAPFAATSYVGAALLGGLANLTQTVLTNRAEHKCTTTNQALWSLGTGLAGGALGGPVNGASVYNEASPWLDQGIAKTLNQQATAQELFGLGNLGRSVAAGFIANFPMPF